VFHEVVAMRRWVKVSIGIAVVTVVLVGGYALYATKVANPRVMVELRSNPNGGPAQRVLLLTLADGTTFPVNYLREGDRVYVGADGGWWRNFRGGGAPVTVYIRGSSLTGHAMAVLDDAAYTHEVFARLRPAAPKWLPDWLNGVLVVITLDAVPNR
jgi:hypothetical protein